MKAIPLTKGKWAFVDDEDFARVSAHSWCLFESGKSQYAQTRWKQKPYFMHRFLLGAEKGQIVDHINGDGLDNRRSNLRFVTKSQNSLNWHTARPSTTGVRGVYVSATGFEAGLTVNTVRHRRWFPTLDQATHYRHYLERLYILY